MEARTNLLHSAVVDSAVLEVGHLIAITLLMAMSAKILLDMRSGVARLLSLQLFLLAVYVSLDVVNYQAIHPVLSFVVARVSSLIPACIWLLAFFLFKGSKQRVPVVMWFVFASYLMLRTLGIALLKLGVLENSLPYYLISIVIPQLIMIGLAMHAIYMATADFDADLVENRRRSRVIFVLAVAVFIVLTRIKTWIVYNGVVVGMDHEVINTPVLDELITLYAVVLGAGFFLFLFRPGEPLFGLLQPVQMGAVVTDMESKRLSESDQRILNTIEQWMDVHKRFMEPGLTVVRFAEELQIHPHRLRRLVRTCFRFDNFNQFLNHYRVKEAAQRLSATTDAVTAIAYEVGFSSISTFNAAFRSVYGTTPTAWRNQVGSKAAAQQSADVVNQPAAASARRVAVADAASVMAAAQSSANNLG